MIQIPAYPYGELNSAAKIEVEAGALVYASAMLLQGVQGNNGCPPHLRQKFHDDFRAEYLRGLFTADGKISLPKAAVAVNGCCSAQSGVVVSEGDPNPPPPPPPIDED